MFPEKCRALRLSYLCLLRSEQLHTNPMSLLMLLRLYVADDVLMVGIHAIAYLPTPTQISVGQRGMDSYHFLSLTQVSSGP